MTPVILNISTTLWAHLKLGISDSYVALSNAFIFLPAHSKSTEEGGNVMSYHFVKYSVKLVT